MSSVESHPLAGALDEARRTLSLAERRWEQRRADDDAALDTMLWLRAARGAWCLGDGDVARRWYARAADELLDVALGFGSGTGTYAYYAELALGCAALSERPSVLARVGDIVRQHPAPPPSSRRRGRWVKTAEPAAVAHEVLRAWAARLVGEPRDAAAATLVASRLAGSLPLQAEQRWRASHWSQILAALEALLDGRAEALTRALLGLDRMLVGEAARAATCSSAVSETLASLAVEWKKAFPRAYAAEAPHTFALVIEPGTGIFATLNATLASEPTAVLATA